MGFALHKDLLFCPTFSFKDFHLVLACYGEPHLMLLVGIYYKPYAYLL